MTPTALSLINGLRKKGCLLDLDCVELGLWLTEAGQSTAKVDRQQGKISPWPARAGFPSSDQKGSLTQWLL